jgi:hypothetical protein
MLRAMKYAAKEENFVAVLGVAISLIFIGTVTQSLGEGWSVANGFYFPICTLTTSSIADPHLTLTHEWEALHRHLRADRYRDSGRVGPRNRRRVREGARDQTHQAPQGRSTRGTTA